MKKDYKKLFLNDLKDQKFVNDKYKNEIESELSDHFEDLKYDLICSGLNESEAEKEALKKIGSPTKIVNTLNYYMKDSKFYTLFETIVLSIVSLPLYYILFMANADLFFPFNNDRSVVFDASIIYQAIIGTVIAIIPILFITRHLTKQWIYNLLVKKELFLNIFFYLIPIIIFHIFLYKNFIGYELRFGNYLSREIINISIITIANIGLIKFWYRRLEINKLIKAKKSKFSKIIKKIIGLFICIYLLVPLVFNLTGFVALNNPSVGVFFDELNEKGYSILHQIFFVKYFFDFLQRFLIAIVFGQSAGILAFWCLGLIYISVSILCLRNLYKYYKSKQKTEFPYFNLAGLFYVISVLVIVPLIPQNIDWKVPVNHISEVIEKRQMLIFYPMSQYMNADEGRLFHYNISYKNNIFNLNQSGSDNLFQISEIKNVNDYKIEKSKENFPGDAWPNDISKEMTEDLKCISYPKNLSDEQVIIEGENEWRCNELWYKEKLIYVQKRDWPWPILEIEIDNEGEFMLLNISNGGYDPTDLYLLSLK